MVCRARRKVSRQETLARMDLHHPVRVPTPLLVPAKMRSLSMANTGPYLSLTPSPHQFRPSRC